MNLEIKIIYGKLYEFRNKNNLKKPKIYSQHAT